MPRITLKQKTKKCLAQKAKINNEKKERIKVPFLFALISDIFFTS